MRIQHQKFSEIYALLSGERVVYVGSTERSLKHRLAKHVSSAHNSPTKNPKLSSWLLTEPKDLTGKVLEVVPIERRYERETYWIAFYDTVDNGLNADKTAKLGRPKGCSNPSGKDHYLYGKKVNPKTWKSSVEARRKEIRCVETGKIYKSQKNAANELKVSPSRINEFFGGKITNVKGFTFERLNSDGNVSRF